MVSGMAHSSSPFALALRVARTPASDAVPPSGSRATDLADPIPSTAIWWTVPGGGTVWPTTEPGSFASALVRALRDPSWAIAVLLDRPPTTLRLAAGRALDLAVAAPHRLVVDAAPRDPRAQPLAAALRLAATTMHGRSAATWRALDVLATTGNNADAAARLLGCSGQAVRAHRRRGHYAATEFLEPLLVALLTAPAAPSARDSYP